jgi:hypothetical protein
MFSTQHRSWLSPLVLLAAALAPAEGRAQAIVMRNDTPMAVVVNMSSVYQGKLFRVRPQLLSPKAASTPLSLPGNKVVTIFDARFPTRSLFQGTIPASPSNLAFSIQPDLPAPRLKLQQVSLPGPSMDKRNGRDVPPRPPGFPVASP